MEGASPRLPHALTLLFPPTGSQAAVSRAASSSLGKFRSSLHRDLHQNLPLGLLSVGPGCAGVPGLLELSSEEVTALTESLGPGAAHIAMLSHNSARGRRHAQTGAQEQTSPRRSHTHTHKRSCARIHIHTQRCMTAGAACVHICIYRHRLACYTLVHSEQAHTLDLHLGHFLKLQGSSLTPFSGCLVPG